MSLDDIARNLAREISRIEGATSEGLYAAGLFIQAESQEIVPQDQGFLINSAYTQMTGDMTVTVGYTAKYAAAVHEMPMTLKGKPRADFGKTGNRSEFGPQRVVSFGGGSGKGTYWDKGENKFLEKAVNNNTKNIVDIVARRAKI